MADFITAYRKFVEPWEGGFANVSGDKGGRTYAGITEKYFPTWAGWLFLNALGRPIRHNEKFPELNDAVINFYSNMWERFKFSQIKNQDVANIIFDFYVNSGNTAIKVIQRLVGVSTDGVMGTNTVNAINAREPVNLHNTIKQSRIDFYKNIVSRDPAQSKFLKGWLKRINSFPTLTKITGGVVILIISVFFIYLLVK